MTCGNFYICMISIPELFGPKIMVQCLHRFCWAAFKIEELPKHCPNEKVDTLKGIIEITHGQILQRIDAKREPDVICKVISQWMDHGADCHRAIGITCCCKSIRNMIPAWGWHILMI